MKDFKLIDLGKFIACIGIMILHVPPFSNNGVAYRILSFTVSLCVPYFFAVSSFLFFRKIDTVNSKTIQILWHFVKRITILYFSWFVIQIIMLPILPWNIFNSRFFSNLFFGSTYPGSWFYSALIISTCIIFFSTIKKWIPLGIGVLVYCYFAISQSNENMYIAGIYRSYNEHFNVMFLSFPYALIWTILGWVMTQQKWRVMLGGISITLALIGITIQVMVLQGFIIEGIISWVLRFYAVVILIILSCKYDVKKEMPYKRIRNISTLVFMIHFYFVHHLRFDFSIYGISGKFLITFCCTLIIALFILRLSQIEKFKILKYLY